MRGQRTEKQEGRSAQEACQAVEHELSAQPPGRVHIGLDALDIRSEPDVVRSVSPINIVTAPVLVLNEKERQEDAGTQCGKPGDVDGAVLASRKKRESREVVVQV